MPQPTVDFRSELAGHAGELKSLARALVRGDEAEDLAHDVLVTALSQRRRPRSLRPWLRQVMRNASRAKARGEIRRTTRERGFATTSPAPPPEDEAIEAELVGALRRALADLDDPYREALEAKYFEERTAADIARSVGLPAATVRWRLQEGLRRVRNNLDDRYDGRRAWVGVFAGWAGVAPPALPTVAATAGSNTMIKLTIAKVLVGGAALTGASVAAVHVATSDGHEAAQEDKATPMYQAAAEGRAAAPPRVLTADEALPPAPQDDAAPAADETAEPKLHVGPPPMKTYEALGECTKEFPLEGDDNLRIDLTFGAAEAGMAEVVDVSAQGRGSEELAECIESALLGHRVESKDFDEMPARVQLFLTNGDKPPVPALDDADEPDESLDIMKAIDRFGLPGRGASDPKTRIVTCGDFDCPFCEKGRDRMDQVLANFEDVAVYWLHHPLPFHTGAEIAARAATAAGHQGKFWEMHDLLFDAQKARSEEELAAMAVELGLDEARFLEDLRDEATAKSVAEQTEVCKASGARGVPSFFVEGDVLIGAQPYERFDEILRAGE